MTNLFDKESERYLLGACLQEPATVFQVCDELSEEDFYFSENKIIFRAIRNLKQEGQFIDHHSVFCEIERMGKSLQMGGVQTLLSYEAYGAGVDVSYYLDRVQEESKRREVIRIAQDMIHLTQKKESNINDTIQDFQKQLAGSGINKSTFESMKRISASYKNEKSFTETLSENVEKSRQGIDMFDGYRTGYPRLDTLIGGLHKENSIIIGARSSSGKTTFMANLMMNLVRQYPDIKIGFFSLEMPKNRIFDKLVCAHAGVSFSRFDNYTLTDFEVSALNQSAKEMESWNIGIFDHTGVSIQKLTSVTRNAIQKEGYHIIMVDYLTLIHGDKRSGSKHQEIDSISKGLKDISREFKIPVICLAQLNRNIYTRADKQPVLADLKESGAIEEDADTVILLHRPAHYDNTKKDYTEVFVSKNRIREALGKVTFEFEKGILNELPTIEELSPSQVVNPSQDKKAREEPSWVI